MLKLTLQTREDDGEFVLSERRTCDAAHNGARADMEESGGSEAQPWRSALEARSVMRLTAQDATVEWNRSRDMTKSRTGCAAKALKAACSLIVLSGALIAGGSASAYETSVLEGRWKADGQNLVIDISACGSQYCGRQAKAQNQCGATVLTLKLKSREPTGELTFEGKLDLPGKKYVAELFVAPDPDHPKAVTVNLIGNDPDAGFRSRDFPFDAQLVRTGNATCRSGVTS